MRIQKKPGEVPAPSYRKVKYLSLVVVMLGVGFAIARLPIIVRTQRLNGRFLASSYKLDEDPPTSPRLQLLRKRENLDEVVASGKTQLEKIVLLRHWTRQQWTNTGAFYYSPWDAVEILDLARQHHNYGFCAQYAMVFLQACQAMGLHARYVELQGHFLTGVWSDELNRWVIMDPTGDCHYERDGVPLRGGELLKAYWDNKPGGIFLVKPDGTKKPVSQEDLKSYRMYSIVEKANQLNSPPKVQVNGGPWIKLEHEPDYRQYPLIGRDNLAIASPYLAWKADGAGEYFKEKLNSDDPDEFSYAMNQTLLFEASRNAKKGLLKIAVIEENCPTFDFFLIKLDEDPWRKAPSNTLFWELHPGMNRFSARVKTKDGWEGPVSSVEYYYKPAWSFFKSGEQKQKV